MERDNEETMKQINDDAEKEILDIKSKNEKSLKQVNDMELRSKAELQLTKNKLTDTDSEIREKERQIQDKETQLEQQKKKIEELKEEIKERIIEIQKKDTTIGEKEDQIYKLKKKTQELEKFKFVLDYKIKELKREIQPKEQEISKLKDQTNLMDRALKKYNTTNASLGFVVDDLRSRQMQMQKIINKNRDKIRQNDTYIQGFKNAVYYVVQYIDNYDQLKRSIEKSLHKYIKDQTMKNVQLDEDIKTEYENQKKYLNNSVTSIKKRLEKERQIHKAEHLKIMKDNVDLITEISHLRKNVRTLDEELKNLKNQVKEENSELRTQKRNNMIHEVTHRTDNQEELYNLNRANDARADHI